MLGDKIKVLDDLYLAEASLVYGEINECFLVNPVVKTSVLGKQQIIGYAEAITGIQVCDVEYIPIFDSNGDLFGKRPILVDSESKAYSFGVRWNINFEKKATEVCTDANIESYFRHADFDVEGRIKYLREEAGLMQEDSNLNRSKSPVRAIIKNY